MLPSYGTAQGLRNGAFVLRSHTAVEVGLDLNQFPPNSVDDGLESVVRAQLLIDVVEVIPQRLGTDVQIAHDVSRVLAFGEASQDALFLV
jgi:hypothetical protein